MLEASQSLKTPGVLEEEDLDELSVLFTIKIFIKITSLIVFDLLITKVIIAFGENI